MAPPIHIQYGCRSFDYVSPDAAELSAALAGREPEIFGHDAIDRWHALKTVIAAAGLPKDWGTCPVCHGHAIHPDYFELYEKWQKEEPPKGDGYQLWEDVTEGSPISPVFSTLDDLCAWCEQNATTFADARATAAQWKQMLNEGFVRHQEGNMIFM